MGYETKSNKPEVHAGLAEGGWDIYYGREVDVWDGVLGIIGTVITGGAGTVAWIEYQMTLQLAKFGQSLDNIAVDILDEIIAVITDCIEHGRVGEWELGGFGVKVNIATYNWWWRIKSSLGSTGWNSLPNTHQPYIGLRLLAPAPKVGVTIDSKTIMEPIELSKILPSPLPSEPTPGSVYDDNYILFRQPCRGCDHQCAKL